MYHFAGKSIPILSLPTPLLHIIIATPKVSGILIQPPTLGFLLPPPATRQSMACLLTIAYPHIRLKIPPAIRTSLPQWLPPHGHFIPMAATSVQTLCYFKNIGLIKRLALKKTTKKGGRHPSHRHTPLLLPHTDKDSSAISGSLFAAANRHT